MRLLCLALCCLAATCLSARGLSAQFERLDSGTTANLRGIDAVSADVAWASGTGGTVLLTTDAGLHWKRCATPKGADKLDLRGIQGFDARTAIAMASGPGTQSALYKTSDGCASWKQVFADPDESGFFDSLRRVTGRQMYMMGDPVGGKFSMFYSPDQGGTWYVADDPGLNAAKGIGGFAASNSSLISMGAFLFFGTSGAGGTPPSVYATRQRCGGADAAGSCSVEWFSTPVPIGASADSAGVFSLAGRNVANLSGKVQTILVAVGGDYKQPTDGSHAAASSRDGGKSWQAASAGPSGYRSAVAYYARAGRWIAVGPNGVDSSSDDGKTWSPVKPAEGAAADRDNGWNALSLPFAVGANGRIGMLRDADLK